MKDEPNAAGPYQTPAAPRLTRKKTHAPRIWTRGAVAGIATFVMSILSAWGYLAYYNLCERQELIDTGIPSEILAEMEFNYGMGDLKPFAFWTLGLSILILFYAAWMTRQTFKRPVPIKIAYLLGIPLLAFLWVVFVAMQLGPWMGAFSFPVFPCWLIGACSGAAVSFVIRPAKLRDSHSEDTSTC